MVFITKEYRRVHKIFTLKGINAFTDLRIPYNIKNEKIEVISAKTWMKDGTVVESNTHGITTLTPRNLNRACIYPDIREKCITHVGLAPDAIIEVHYKKICNKKTIPYLWGECAVTSNIPKLYREINISIPSKDELVYELINDKKEIEVNNENSKNIYNWKWKNLSAIYPENNSYNLREVAARIVYSTCKSWNELSRFVQKEICEKLRPYSKLKKSLEKENLYPTDKYDLISSTYKYIKRDYYMIHCTPELFSYKPIRTKKIYNMGHANTFDMTLFMKSALNMRDVNSELVFYS